MLVIKITEGDTTTGCLKFEVNGRPSNTGDGGAKRNWQVHWIVGPNSDVLSIADIRMKTGRSAPPNTDIFSDCPPSQRGSQGNHWVARVDKKAPVGDEYNYDIFWKEKITGIIRKHDPKITVMPSVGPISKLLTAICIAVTGFLALKFLQNKINR